MPAKQKPFSGICKHPTRARQAWAGLLLLLLSLVLAAVGGRALQAQQVSRVEATSFKVQLETYAPPFHLQIKTSLEGQKADPQPGGIIVLTEPRLNRFTTNGALEIQVRSPQCLYNVMKQTVSSSNLLQVEMADGRFFTESRGFFRGTNGVILLSNDVRTVIRMPARRPAKL